MAAVAAGAEFPGDLPRARRQGSGLCPADANLAFAVENIVDAGYFNTGQGCCAIERIYVHEAVYDDFVEAAVAVDQRLQARLADRSGDRRSDRWCAPSAADAVRAQVAEAIRQGARPLIDAKRFAADKAGTPYLAPQLLANVDHSMASCARRPSGRRTAS